VAAPLAGDFWVGPLPPLLLLARTEGQSQPSLSFARCHPISPGRGARPDTTHGRARRAPAAPVHPAFSPGHGHGTAVPGWALPLFKALSAPSLRFSTFYLRRQKGMEQTQPLKKHVHHGTEITYTIYRDTPRYKIYVHALSSGKPRPRGWAARPSREKKAFTRAGP